MCPESQVALTSHEAEPVESEKSPSLSRYSGKHPIHPSHFPSLKPWLLEHVCEFVFKLTSKKISLPRPVGVLQRQERQLTGAEFTSGVIFQNKKLLSYETAQQAMENWLTLARKAQTQLPDGQSISEMQV